MQEDEEFIDHVTSYFTFEKVPAGTVLVKENTIAEKFYYLLNGTIRQICQTEECSGRIINLYSPGSIVTSVGSFLSDTPSDVRD